MAKDIFEGVGRSKTVVTSNAGFWIFQGDSEELKIDFGGATKISGFDIKWEVPRAVCCRSI